MKAFSSDFYKPARAILLVAVLFLVLSGCGGGGGGNDGNSQADSNKWDAMVWDQDNWG